MLAGGCDKRRPPGPNNELYKLDMSDKETFYWMRINASNPPPARWHHTAHLLTDNKTMLVFGGFSTNFGLQAPVMAGAALCFLLAVVIMVRHQSVVRTLMEVHPQRP